MLETQLETQTKKRVIYIIQDVLKFAIQAILAFLKILLSFFTGMFKMIASK